MPSRETGSIPSFPIRGREEKIPSFLKKGSEKLCKGGGEKIAPLLCVLHSAEGALPNWRRDLGLLSGAIGVKTQK